MDKQRSASLNTPIDGMRHPRKAFKHQNKGFALIATLSITALIIILTLAMLSMASVVIRTSGHAYHSTMAQANAKLALNEALITLQAHLGPDMRVSTEADIFTTASLANNNSFNCHPTKKHLVAVFNTEAWHARDADGMPNNYKEYSKDRNNNAFMRYLVSGKTTDVTNKNYAELAIKTDYVKLVDEGTLGTTATDADKVAAPLTQVADTGGYAWWIGDEGVKASYALVDQRDVETGDLANMPKYRHMNPEQMGLSSLSDFSSMQHEASQFKSELKKVITRKTMEVHSEANATSVTNIALKMREKFHDLTWGSAGVLASTARPGLKRDLSLAFELPDHPDMWFVNGSIDHKYTLMSTDDYKEFHTFHIPRLWNVSETTINKPARPSTFDEIWEFSNSGDERSSFVHGRCYTFGSRNVVNNWWNKKVGYVYNYPKPNNISNDVDKMGNKLYLRGPSWSLLRHHYRLYKREYENMPASDYRRRNVPAPSDNRTWLSRPYLGYGSHADSNGVTNLVDTYGGNSSVLNTGGDVYQATSIWNPFFNYGDASRRNDVPWNNRDHQSYGVTPIITKVGVVFSVYRKHNDANRVRIAMDTVGTVWNPYNVPIECPAIFHSLDFHGIRWDMEKNRSGAITQGAIDRQSNTHGANKYFPFRFNRVGVSNDGTSSPSGNWTLNPGEIRTYTMGSENQVPTGYSWSTLTAKPCQFQNFWEGGQDLVFGSSGTSGAWSYRSGDTITFRFRASSESLRLRSFLGYFKSISGATVNPFDTVPDGTEYQDLPEISSLHIIDNSSGFSEIEKVVTAVPLSTSSNIQKLPVAYFEFRRETTDTSSESMGHQLEPRAIVTGGKSIGETNADLKKTPIGWVIEAKSINDFADVQAGVDLGGSDGNRNSGFFGTSHSGSGESHVVLFEVPDTPITNIGMMQSVQLGPTAYDLPYAIGGSAKHLKLNKNELIREHTITGFDFGKHMTNTLHPGSSGTPYNTEDDFTNAFYDSAYLVNSNLWDNYFFSGLTLPATVTHNNAMDEAEKVMKKFMDYNEKNPLKNRRLIYTPNRVSEDDVLKQLTHHRWMAKNMMLDGAFNVNSTKVEAWKAVLTGMRNKAVSTVNKTSGALSTDGGTGTAFPRMLTSAGVENELWLGYSRLTDAQIATLATNIVTQVKQRGPFLSLADFINRRIANDSTGEMGALQEAIEATSGLQTSGAGSNEKGITGTIKQNDILASIGGVISARSDTFIIRAYGESKDKNGNIMAKAYLEASVQRIPQLKGDNDMKLLDIADPLYDSAKTPAHMNPYKINPAVSQDAKILGRKFIITNFKWLNESEI